MLSLACGDDAVEGWRQVLPKAGVAVVACRARERVNREKTQRDDDGGKGYKGVSLGILFFKK